MESQNEKILSLLEKFEKGKASHQELNELDTWYDSFQQNAQYTDGLTRFQEGLVKANLFEGIQSGIRKEDKPSVMVERLWPRILSAAVVLLIAGSGVIFFFNSQVVLNLFQKSVKTQYANDIRPGSNKAVLTLGNGKAIDLIGNKKGVVIDTELTYNDGTLVTGENEMTIQTLTMQTPRGGQYEATLPDGTRVWLNAASKLKFPSKFTGKNRVVELSGEAYFQVAHNKAKPFKVKSYGQEVEVLGTHFNINSYPEEHVIKTTLLEGKIQVTTGKIERILLPGTQASSIDGKISVEHVNPNRAIAWKDKKILFKNDNIRTIMRMIARWYDVEVIYKGEITKETFSGGVSRSDYISKVLQSLESAGGVRFEIEGKRVYVFGQ